MSDVWDSELRGPTATHVLVALANEADDDGRNCFPGLRRIARRARVSERTVIRTIQDLEREGWLKVIERRHGPRAYNMYELNAERLQEQAARTRSAERARKGDMVSYSRRPNKAARKPGKDDTVSHYSAPEKVTSARRKGDIGDGKGDIGDRALYVLPVLPVKAPTTPPAPPLVAPTGKSSPLGTPTAGGSAGSTETVAPKENAGDAGAVPETAELNAEQQAHVDRIRKLRGDRDAREYEAFYREENAKTARKQREREARAQALAAESIRMRELMPTRETARAWVMQQCGFAASRRGRGVAPAVEAVLGLEHERGVEWHVTAQKMAAAWRDWVTSAPLLRWTCGPPKFFLDGMWRDRVRWPWDDKKLEAAARAAVGERM